MQFPKRGNAQGDIKMNKKGQVSALPALAVGVGVAAIVTAFVLQIQGDIKSDMTVNSSEYNATGEGVTAVAKITGKLGIIVTVVLAVFIIGLLAAMRMRG